MPILSRRRAKRTEARNAASGMPVIRPPMRNLVSGTGLLLVSRIGPPYRTAWESSPEYHDAVLRCRTCGDLYDWSAEDQRIRSEVWHRGPYSYPAYCPECSHAWHRKKALLAEYDAKVGAAREGRDYDLKRRVLALIGALQEAGREPTGRMLYTQDILTRQLASAARRDAAGIRPLPTRNGRPLGR